MCHFFHAIFLNFINSLHQMIQKYGSAFLNSEGGVLIGGVTDEGKSILLTLESSTQIFEFGSLLARITTSNTKM